MANLSLIQQLKKRLFYISLIFFLTSGFFLYVVTKHFIYAKDTEKLIGILANAYKIIIKEEGETLASYASLS